jgi:hypothetical protein
MAAGKGLLDRLPEDDGEDNEITRFRAWLMVEAADDIRRLQTSGSA